MRRNSRSGSSRPVRQGWQTNGPVKVFAALGTPVGQQTTPSTMPSTTTTTQRRSASASRAPRSDSPQNTGNHELVRTLSSSSGRPASGNRGVSTDTASRTRSRTDGNVAPETAWDAKPRDPYAQFFMQRSHSTGATGSHAVTTNTAGYNTGQHTRPSTSGGSNGTSALYQYYTDGKGGEQQYGTATSTGEGSSNPRSLFRRNHTSSSGPVRGQHGTDQMSNTMVTRPTTTDGSERMDQAWTRQRPTSAASIRPTSAARGRGDGHQTLGDAIAMDAAALVNSATKGGVNYSRPSSADVTGGNGNGVVGRTQVQGQSQGRSYSTPHVTPGNVAMLGVGAGLAAALGLRNAKASHDEVPPTGRNSTGTSSQQGTPVLLTGNAIIPRSSSDGKTTNGQPTGVSSTNASYNSHTVSASTKVASFGGTGLIPSSRGRTPGGLGLTDMDDGDDVEAALKAAAKRSASAGPTSHHHTAQQNGWMATPTTTMGTGGTTGTGGGQTTQYAYGAAITTMKQAGGGDSSHARSRSVGVRPASASMKPSNGGGGNTGVAGGESTESGEMVGEEDSADGTKRGDGTAQTPSNMAKLMMGRNAATVSSVTAGSSPGHGEGGQSSNVPMTEEEIRQMHREREYQLRQKLKAYVASSEFDGKSNTDFYGFGKVLGQGSFGKVRLAWHRLAGCKVAIKSYEKSKLTEPNHWRRVQQEISLMEQLNHPNLIRMLETIDSPKRIHIVMEFAGGGNLCSHVKSKKRLPEPEARNIFVQLMAGLEYMHNNGVIHRDVKLENVLFAEDGNMNLLDFGFSVLCRDPNKKLKIFCGTPSYMAPEIVMRKEYLGRPVDVWSLGVLLYACLCGCFPFVAKTYPDLYKKIAQAQVTFPDYMSNNAKDLIKKMLHPDPLQRATLAQVRKHPFCGGAAPPIFRAIPSEMSDKALLTSEDPREDLYEAALKKAADLGLKRQSVLDAVLSRSRCGYACVYYLIIHRYGRKRLIAASEQLASQGGDTSGKVL